MISIENVSRRGFLKGVVGAGAFVLGVVQLSAPKGTLPHRTVGWIWVTLMLVVSISAFFIHQLRIWGQWSPIHLLAIFTLSWTSEHIPISSGGTRISIAPSP